MQQYAFSDIFSDPDSRYGQVKDFVTMDANVNFKWGDRIILHVNVPEMLLDAEFQDAQLRRRLSAAPRVTLEKAVGLLREHPIMHLDSLCPCDPKNLVELVIHCCFDPPRGEQL
jgi:hypothetical protein